MIRVEDEFWEGGEYFEGVKIDILWDEVFVYSGGGDVMNLGKG